jgi:putative PIN family toxin of toxin-antitoxin system
VRILIDTNVLIAAYTSYGVCASVVNYCMKEHQLCSSEFILTELEKQLQKKFNLSEKEVKEVSGLIRKVSLIAEYDYNIIPKVCRDPDDNHILAAAEVLNVDYIITGDNDLLELKKYKGISIVTPREFVLREF